MRRIFRKDLRNDPPRQLSRSRLALGILEVIAKRRFRYDLAKGIMPADIGGAMISSSRKCWRREIFSDGSAG